MKKIDSLLKLILETTAELIIIFTAAAAGAVIGSGRQMTSIEHILSFIFVLLAIITKKKIN
ncbi:MAG: hypothetical protein KC506_00900 [Nanoarchaeota archaeon]|nr:hypothetical protein [Nanoarchaeota archaeon]